MSTSFARDALLKLRWALNGIDGASVLIISRSSHGTTSELKGRDISDIGRSFMTLKDGTMVPFHRVLSIKEGTVTVWSRKANDIDVKDHHVLGR